MNEITPLAVDTGRGFSINYKGKSLYSKYAPSRNPERIASSVEMEEETLYLIPSPLLMYGVDKLLENLPESSFLLCLEADQSLMKLTLESLGDYKHPRLELVRLDRREQLKQMIDDLGIWRFRRCRSVFLNSGYNLYKDLYDRLIDFAALHLSTFWRNRLTLNKLGGLWIKNIFLNLPFTGPAKPDNQGKPIVICGAGPSLDTSLPIMRKHRDSIYIVAVDTALSTLKDGGIVPDLVYALESQFYNLWDFHNTGDISFDLLADITSYPQVCRMNNGIVYCSYTDFYANKLLMRLSDSNLVSTRIPPLGSVGVAAVFVALNLFKENIYITGLDFSYIPGKSHSKGSPFSKSHMRSSNRLHPIDSFTSAVNRQLIRMTGKNGYTEILTDSILASYARLLTDILSETDRVFDITDQGYPLGIPMIDSITFEEHMNLNEDNAINRKKEHKVGISQRKAFLRKEKNLLQKLINEWDDFNRSEVEQIPLSMMESLQDVDYIYIDFPDRLPHPVKEVSFITRAVKSARAYIELIDRVIDQMD